MKRDLPEWLYDVLQNLEDAFVLLTECEAGRAPCGGSTFAEQRRLAAAKAGTKVEQAQALYESKGTFLPRASRKRAAALFGAVYLLQQRVTGGIVVAPDAALAGHLQRFEAVAN